MLTAAQPISSRSGVTADKVIEIHDLWKAFGTNRVMNGFDFHLDRGENVVVLGKSGSGKSVLIKCIIGLLEPDSGSIDVLGKNVPDLDLQELDRLRVKIGFLFQSNALYDSMTVRNNLEFPLRRHWMEVSQKDVNGMVMEALENVGLEHTVDMMPEELSGGMRKRIALARTLILKPDIILYDEPTTGLDPITGKEIGSLMLEIRKKYGTSSLIISHDMRCIKQTSDRIVLLNEGKAYAEGTYSELARSADTSVNEFFE